MSIIVKAMVAAETLIENIRRSCEAMKDGDVYKTSSVLPTDIVVTRSGRSLKWIIGDERLHVSDVRSRLTQAYIEDGCGASATVQPIILQVGDVVRCCAKSAAIHNNRRLRFEGLSVIHQVNLQPDSLCYSIAGQAWFQRHELEFVEASSAESIDYLFKHLAANDADENYDEDEDDPAPEFLSVHDRPVPNWRDDLQIPAAPENEPDYDI